MSRTLPGHQTMTVPQWDSTGEAPSHLAAVHRPDCLRCKQDSALLHLKEVVGRRRKLRRRARFAYLNWMGSCQPLSGNEPDPHIGDTHTRVGPVQKLLALMRAQEAARGARIQARRAEVRWLLLTGGRKRKDDS